jgi:hypothetical protein
MDACLRLNQGAVKGGAGVIDVQDIKKMWASEVKGLRKREQAMTLDQEGGCILIHYDE